MRPDCTKIRGRDTRGSLFGSRRNTLLNEDFEGKVSLSNHQATSPPSGHQQQQTHDHQLLQQQEQQQPQHREQLRNMNKVTHAGKLGM